MPKKRENRVSRFILWFIAILFLLIVSAGTYLYFYAGKLINENLSDFIYQNTDSIYRLEFNKITFDNKSRSITITDIAFKPDSASVANSLKSYYEFETDSLTLRGIKLMYLLKEKKLSAVSLKVQHPNFRLSNGQEVDIDMFASQKIAEGDSLRIPFLNEVLIDTILVTDAHLKIDTIENFYRKGPKVNIEILQFKIGGKKLTDLPFPFDVSDISLKVENIQENLSDKIHVLSVGEIGLSLLHSKIRAKNVILRPHGDTISTVENQYHIEVPEIEINSPHVENFYLSDTIPIDMLTFTSPSISIKFGNKIRKGTPINDINIYKLIEKNFKWINIGLFSIKNADLKLYPAGSDELAQHFENLNIDFTQFRADPTTYKDKDRLLSARELAISIDHFTLNHTDKVHQLVINNLTADTKNQIITTGAISFRPINPSNKLMRKANTLLDIGCKGAIFNKVQFSKMYHDQIIRMDELYIYSPEANISFEKVELNRQTKKDISLILQKTRDYVKGVYVKKTSISDGTLNYNYISGEDKNGFFRTKFQFQLMNLSLDSITFYQSKKIFFADNCKVRFTDIGLQLADNFHRLLTDSIFLSSEGKTAEIFNFRILPVKTIPSGDSLSETVQREIYDVSFPVIKLTGADLHKAFFEKELNISSFNVLNPSLNIEFFDKGKTDKTKTTGYKAEFYSLISSYLFKINIGSLKMDNGHLDIVQHRKGLTPIEFSNSFSINMLNFEIDSLSSREENKLFFSDDIDMVLKKQSFSLDDGVHYVTADEIGILSTEKRLYITNAKMHPDILSENFKKMPLAVYANIPFVEFTGADIKELLSKGNFPVKAITFTNPEIKLLFQPGIKQETDTTQMAQLIIKGLKAFGSDQIDIKNGSLEISNYINRKSKTFATTTVELVLNNYKVVNDQNLFKTSYGDYAFTIKNTILNLNDKTHEMFIGNTNYTSINGLLKLSDLKIQPVKDVSLNDKKEFYTIIFPKMSMADFNLSQFIENKKIISSMLTIDDPVIKLKDNRIEKSSSFNPYKLNLFPTIKSYVETIDIGQVLVNNASINLDNPKPLRLSQMNLSGKSFLVDKTSDSNENLLSCKNIDFELNNLKGKTKDGFYNFMARKISLNEQGRFAITDISLIPAYPESEFNLRKVYQEDYITIPRADCIGQDFDLKRYFEKNEIAIGKANLTFDRVDIFRNNHYPIPPGFKIEMPQKELRNLKQKFIADSIFLYCDRFNYRELELQATGETRLFFTDIYSTVSHLTNINKNLLKDPFTNLQIGGKLMNEGVFNIKIDLNMQSVKNEYKVEAELGKMPLTLMNTVTEPSLRLSVKEGMNNNFSAYFEADEDTSTGTLQFSYSDLKISVLNDKDGSVNEEKFISFLANTFAVKSDNPRPGRLITPVKIKTGRDKQKTFINYCWISLFSGIKNTFGIKEKEEYH